MDNQKLLHSLKYLLENAGEFGCEDLAEIKNVDYMISTTEPDAGIISVELADKKYSIIIRSNK